MLRLSALLATLALMTASVNAEVIITSSASIFGTGNVYYDASANSHYIESLPTNGAETHDNPHTVAVTPATIPSTYTVLFTIMDNGLPDGFINENTVFPSAHVAPSSTPANIVFCSVAANTFGAYGVPTSCTGTAHTYTFDDQSLTLCTTPLTLSPCKDTVTGHPVYSTPGYYYVTYPVVAGTQIVSPFAWSGDDGVPCTGPGTPQGCGPNIVTDSVTYDTTFTITSTGTVGDPQFVGLRGQSYQIHGVDGMIYNLVSSASTQVNARFVFLNSGACPIVEGVKAVNCWSHPGSYLGAIGVQQMVSSGATHQLEINSGDAQHGFESIVLNGKPMSVGDSFTDDVFSVTVLSTHTVSIKTEEFSFVLDNSDRFINQAVSPRIPLSQISAHGLFGQTSERKVYNSMIKYIAGDVDDYVIAEGSLFGTDFAYNRFNATL